jgi:hypothetical protein
MVRTFLKVYMELGSYFLFLQEQIKDIIIIISLHGEGFPRTLMRGSPDGTIEPNRHRQETLDLAA